MSDDFKHEWRDLQCSDRFLRNIFMIILFTLRTSLCWKEIAKEIFFIFDMLIILSERPVGREDFANWQTHRNHKLFCPFSIFLLRGIFSNFFLCFPVLAWPGRLNRGLKSLLYGKLKVIYLKLIHKIYRINISHREGKQEYAKLNSHNVFRIFK